MVTSREDAMKSTLALVCFFFKEPDGTETHCIYHEPEEARDFLNGYCRAKIDAKNIEAGQPMWADAADKAQERRP